MYVSSLQNKQKEGRKNIDEEEEEIRKKRA
jgi:hypothetical protein